MDNVNGTRLARPEINDSSKKLNNADIVCLSMVQCTKLIQIVEPNILR